MIPILGLQRKSYGVGVGIQFIIAIVTLRFLHDGGRKQGCLSHEFQTRGWVGRLAFQRHGLAEPKFINGFVSIE